MFVTRQCKASTLGTPCAELQSVHTTQLWVRVRRKRQAQACARCFVITTAFTVILEPEVRAVFICRIGRATVASSRASRPVSLRAFVQGNLSAASRQACHLQDLCCRTRSPFLALLFSRTRFRCELLRPHEDTLDIHAVMACTHMRLLMVLYVGDVCK